MKTALITTTINVPSVLELYRKYDSAVRFFIAGDIKSPHQEIESLCDALGNARYIPPCVQGYWKCSELIGWNCIQRRNIALLEAVEWGADIIYTCDDDNIPMSRWHFGEMWSAFAKQPFTGLSVYGPSGWLDPGQLLIPPTRQRGFPHDYPQGVSVSPIVDAKIGVVSGACLGDPDIGAMTRIEVTPDVTSVHELLRGGVVVAPNARTIFNTQNTAFTRELAPAMLLMPQFKRYDDIFMSLVAQRVMRERDLHVHLGRPFVYQQRNEHNLLRDLEAETFGMNAFEEFEETVNGTVFIIDGAKPTVCNMVEAIYHRVAMTSPLADRTSPFANIAELSAAWVEDMKGVL